MYLVTGGRTYKVDYLDSTELYDPSLGSWRNGARLPSGRRGLRAANVDNQILLFGKNFSVKC